VVMDSKLRKTVRGKRSHAAVNSGPAQAAVTTFDCHWSDTKKRKERNVDVEIKYEGFSVETGMSESLLLGCYTWVGY